MSCSGFDDLVAASGRIRDALVTVGDHPELLRRSARQLDEIAAALESAALNPDPGYMVRDRGLIPRHTVTVDDGMHLAGHTTVERHFDGVGAVHGGAIALLFDELLGRLANTARPMARTAFLRMDFRVPAPWGVQLDFACRIEKIEGRKRFLAGDLMRDDVVLAQASGLWVELRPDTSG